MKKLTNEEFIAKAMQKHPEYDYSLCNYNGGKNKVTIICKIHGAFEIRGCDLLNGYGCPKCGGTKKLTNDEFILMASQVHNNYFSYEKCNYINSGSKVVVTCPIHGDFEVKANNHLNGCNCKKCQKEKIFHEITLLPKRNNSTKKLTNNDFLEKCKEKYGDRYDYSKTNYTKANEKVCIICHNVDEFGNEHGEFYITPMHFLNGRGCPKCGRNYRLTTNDFIIKSKSIHGDTYDYSLSNYKSTHDKLIITCKQHGPFQQSPANHLNGKGCPICDNSILENKISLFLKDNNIKYECEKTFDWLKKEKNLYLDFYLPDYKIAIECQGIQHFQPVFIFGGEKTLNENKERDLLKRKLCNENGITMLYFSNLNIEYPYEVITNIEDLLTKILNKND